MMIRYYIGAENPITPISHFVCCFGSPACSLRERTEKKRKLPPDGIKTARAPNFVVIIAVVNSYKEPWGIFLSQVPNYNLSFQMHPPLVHPAPSDDRQKLKKHMYEYMPLPFPELFFLC